MIAFLFLLIILGAGSLLIVMGWVAYRKGFLPGTYPIRALMGWCFIWILERLLAETYLPEKYRPLYLVLALVASLGWYIWVWIRLKNRPATRGLEDKLEEIGRSDKSEKKTDDENSPSV
jgi:predicted membrane channel-forming protein YqfA (hemolysin III family)